MRLPLLVVVFIATQVVLGGTTHAAGEMKEIGDKKVFFSSTRATGDEAALACQDMSMSLVSLESAEKYLPIKEAHCNGSSSDWIFWTSGRLVDDHFEWTGGTAAGQVFDYTAWDGIEPNQLESPYDICVLFTCLSDWADDPCFFSYAYICE